MKLNAQAVLVIVSTVMLTGCADSGSTASNNTSASPAAISMPGTSNNPPVVFSGYVDTSATTQSK